jgi:hypothetical protein
MRSLASILFPIVLVGISGVALAAEASTSDFSRDDPKCNGSRVSHYTVSDAGMLSAVTHWKCTGNSGNARAGICQLDQTLKCRSDLSFEDKFGHPIDLSGYSVGLPGVTAAGVLHPWIDAQAASIVVRKLQDPAQNPLAQQAAKNRAAMEKMGGEENLNQIFTAGMCRVTLIAAGIVQPTAKEMAQDANNKKNHVRITVDTSPERVESCKTIIRDFCSRSDLPPSVTQTADYDYPTVCGGARVK